MSLAESLLPEFDQEMAVTRRVLERVPGDKAEWKPRTRLDLQGAAGYSLEKTETLLAGFDQNVRDARAVLQAATDADFAVPWSLTRGEQVLFTAPRAAVVRSHISHLSHHRGQLTVYLRLLDVPVPSIYGPTADERM